MSSSNSPQNQRVVRWRALTATKDVIARIVEMLMSFIGKTFISIFGLVSFFMISIVVIMIFAMTYGVLRDLILKWVS